jgi:1,2-phenylacetyl-CoA epoxidase catalytic subunit
MGPMLKEESFHLGTGANGLRRIVKQGVIPCELLQKYLNKWISTGLDLFELMILQVLNGHMFTE